MIGNIDGDHTWSLNTMVGLSRDVKRLILALWRGQPLTAEQEEFVASIAEEMRE